MYLKSLSLLNFKNIREVSLAFSPKINCLLGNNGMGKTNLLEAVYYLSFCKGFIHQSDVMNVTFGEEFFMIKGEYAQGDKHEEYSCAVKHRQKKQFRKNSKEYDRLSDHIGIIPLVLVSPADAEIISGGSDFRRRFVDLALSQYDRNYLHSLIQYNKLLAQRNALLKQEPNASDDLYEVIELQMDHHADAIHAGRKRFVDSFVPFFQSYHNKISADREEVSIVYESNMVDTSLAEQLFIHRPKDRIVGFTTKGVHKDDFGFFLGNHLIRKVGSQGQNKTFLLSLKLAQFNFLSTLCRTKPILLLDDLFDKLDAERVEQLIGIVSGDDFGQIFITDTNRNHLDRIVSKDNPIGKFFLVEEGVVNIMEASE